MNYEVTLVKEDILKAVGFAKGFWEAEKSTKDFGSEDNRDSKSDKFADTISGKLAEQAFAIFARREFNIAIELDFSINKGIHNIDNGQDVMSINGNIPVYRADIKGSKKFAKWLLIEKHKIDPDLIISHFYISVSLDIPNDIEKDWSIFLGKDMINATVDGYLKAKHFFYKGSPWFGYKRGDRLYSISYIDDIILKWENSGRDFNLYEQLQSELASAEQAKMNIVLKANENIGFPKKYLKSGKEDFLVFFRCLTEGDSRCV